MNKKNQALFTEINKVVEQIKLLHPNDPKIYELWDYLFSILIIDKNRTLAYLEGLNNPDIINHLSAIFEDLSGEFQSIKLIDIFEEYEKKFPEIPLKHMVAAARDRLN